MDSEDLQATVNLTIPMSRELRSAFQHAAQLRDESMAQAVRRFVNEYVKQTPPKRLL